MKDKMPETEHAWRECLSAYLDGELEADERRAVETWLAREPARARQLEELRRVGGLLQAWTVEAPEPAPEFLRKIEEISNLKSQISNHPWLQWREWFTRPLRIPWPVTAAIFLAGVLAGAGGMRLVSPLPSPTAATSRTALPPHPPVMVAEATAPAPAATPVISDRQAAALWARVRTASAKAPPDHGVSLLDREALVRKYRERLARSGELENENSGTKNEETRQIIERYRIYLGGVGR